MAEQTLDVLQRVIQDFHAQSPERQAEMMDDFLEEQPYLGGFLYNLEEDFEEQQLEAMVESALCLKRSLQLAGMPVALVEPETLTQTIEERVAAYEAFADSGEEVSYDSLLKLCASPLVMTALVNYVESQREEGGDQDPDQVLVLDIIITALEESIAPESSNEH